jgi:hypothetical protein
LSALPQTISSRAGHVIVVILWSRIPPFDRFNLLDGPLRFKSKIELHSALCHIKFIISIAQSENNFTGDPARQSAFSFGGSLVFQLNTPNANTAYYYCDVYATRLRPEHYV